MSFPRFRHLLSLNPLYFAFALPFFLDSTLTLLGQGSVYWHHPQLANESSPTYFVLALGPVIYVLFALCWAALLYGIMYTVKEPLNLIISMGLLIYHTQGSSAWLTLVIRRIGLGMFPHRMALLMSWSLMVTYFVLVGICAAYSVQIYHRNHP